MIDMDQIVADASVVVKFFINEEYSECARKILDGMISGDLKLVEPALLFYEVMNAVRYSKVKKFSIEELGAVIEALENLDFEVADWTADIARKAVELSKRYNITIYDATYVALAGITGSRFYSSDQRLLDSVKVPYARHVREF
jgi:predicted nucleic acid-binding protein